MTTCQKPNEMPIVFDRLNAFDEDNSGGLNVKELGKMVPSDVGLVFVYGVSVECDVSIDAALDIYERLDPNTRFEVIKELNGHKVDSSQKFKSILIEKDTVLLAKDFIRKWKEAGSDDFKKRYVVLDAVLLISDVSPKVRDVFLKAIQRVDPAFAKTLNVEIENNFKPSEFDTASKAIDVIYQDLIESGTNVKDQPIIFGVGEKHPSSKALSDARIPAEYFGETILPELVKKYDVKILACDYITSDASNYGPIDLNNLAVKLSMSIKPSSARSIKALIKSVQKLSSEGYNVAVVGIGPTTTKILNYWNGEVTEKELIDSINTNASKFANKLKNENGNAVIYSEASRNDLNGVPYEDIDLSYVPLLEKDASFVSIDIVASDYIQHPNNSAEWNAMIFPPKNGIRLFQRGFKSDYVIVFSRDHGLINTPALQFEGEPENCTVEPFGHQKMFHF